MIALAMLTLVLFLVALLCEQKVARLVGMCPRPEAMGQLRHLGSWARIVCMCVRTCVLAWIDCNQFGLMFQFRRPSRRALGSPCPP